MPFKNIVKALYSYRACEEDELSFEEDDILCILACDEGEWWSACMVKDQEISGLVPLNYIEPLESIGTVKALYSYVAEEENEIGFEEDDKLWLLNKLDDDWWLMKNANNEYGLVPSNYVTEEIDETKCDPTIGIFSAILDTVDEEYQDPLEQYRQELSAQKSPLWLSTVQIQYKWNATFLQGKTRIKGHLVVSHDNNIAFIEDDEKPEVFRHALQDVVPLEIEMGKTEGKEVLKVIHTFGPLLATPVNIVDGTVIQSAKSPDLPARPTAPQIASPKSPTSHSQRLDSPVNPIVNPDAPKVVALFDYQPQADDELKIEQGESLSLLDDGSDDWWLVQRLYGSCRRGLVPKAYVKIVESEKEQELKTEEKNELRMPSRTASPRPVFLEELISKTRKSVEALQISEHHSVADGREETTESYSESPKAVLKMPIPVPPPLPSTFTTSIKSPLSAPPLPSYPRDEPSIAAETSTSVPPLVSAPPSPHPSDRPISPISPQPPSPAHSKEDIKESSGKSPVDKMEVMLPEKPPNPQEAKVYRPYRVTSPKADFAGSSAISAILLKKQNVQPNKTKALPPKFPTVCLRSVEGRKAAVVQVQKPNPWSKLSMKKITTLASNADKTDARGIAETASKTLPSRPEKATSSDKPRPGNTRLWTNKSGQFQVEAEYLGFLSNKVSLHKLNGIRISVPIDQLCERDMEFVYRREGIPWSRPPKSLVYNGFDWLSFFTSAGIESRKAMQYGQKFVDERLDESVLRFKVDCSFLKSRDIADGDIGAVMKAVSKKRTEWAEREATQRNLEMVRNSVVPVKQEYKALEPMKPQVLAPVRPMVTEFPHMQSTTMADQASRAWANEQYNMPFMASNNMQPMTGSMQPMTGNVHYNSGNANMNFPLNPSVPMNQFAYGYSPLVSHVSSTPGSHYSRASMPQTQDSRKPSHDMYSGSYSNPISGQSTLAAAEMHPFPMNHIRPSFNQTSAYNSPQTMRIPQSIYSGSSANMNHPGNSGVIPGSNQPQLVHTTTTYHQVYTTAGPRPTLAPPIFPTIQQPQLLPSESSRRVSLVEDPGDKYAVLRQVDPRAPSMLAPNSNNNSNNHFK